MSTIIYDTREKVSVIEPLLDEFRNCKISLIRQKLDVGDYANPDNYEADYAVIVDRKHNLSEIAADLGFYFQRFKNEILRCRQQKKFLVVLIADPTRSCLEDVKSWKPSYNTHGKKKAMNGEKLFKIMNTQMLYYQDCLRYEFVAPDKMAKRIMELLKVAD